MISLNSCERFSQKQHKIVKNIPYFQVQILSLYLSLPELDICDPTYHLEELNKLHICVIGGQTVNRHTHLAHPKAKFDLIISQSNARVILEQLDALFQRYLTFISIHIENLIEIIIISL